MHIRPFQPADAPALHRVFLASVHGLAARHYTPEQCAAWAQAGTDPAAWAARLGALRPFVAQREGAGGGDVAGFADLQPDGLIDMFFVAPAHARQGVGDALMARLLAQAAAWGLKEVHAHVSLAAEAFFARHGFTVGRRQRPVRQGVALDNALMRRAVSAA